MLSVCHYFTTSDCQAVALPLFHSSQAFSAFLLRPVRLSSLFLFPSAVATSSSLSGFSVCSCTSFFCLFHLKPSTPSSFSFLNIFSPHLMPSSPCYICAVHSSFCGCLSLSSVYFLLIYHQMTHACYLCTSEHGSGCVCRHTHALASLSQ